MEGFNIDFAHPGENFLVAEEGRINERKLIGIVICLLLLAALFTHLHQRMKNKANDPYQYALMITPAWQSVPDVSSPEPKSAFRNNVSELVDEFLEFLTSKSFLKAIGIILVGVLLGILLFVMFLIIRYLRNNFDWERIKNIFNNKPQFAFLVGAILAFALMLLSFRWKYNEWGYFALLVSELLFAFFRTIPECMSTTTPPQPNWQSVCQKVFGSMVRICFWLALIAETGRQIIHNV